MCYLIYEELNKEHCVFYRVSCEYPISSSSPRQHGELKKRSPVLLFLNKNNCLELIPFIYLFIYLQSPFDDTEIKSIVSTVEFMSILMLL